MVSWRDDIRIWDQAGRGSIFVIRLPFENLKNSGPFVKKNPINAPDILFSKIYVSSMLLTDQFTDFSLYLNDPISELSSHISTIWTSCSTIHWTQSKIWTLALCCRRCSRTTLRTCCTRARWTCPAPLSPAPAPAPSSQTPPSPCRPSPRPAAHPR